MKMSQTEGCEQLINHFGFITVRYNRCLIGIEICNGGEEWKAVKILLIKMMEMWY